MLVQLLACTSTEVQATLLNFLGQQAIAHAATVFATLAAAFAFAQAVRQRGIATFPILILNVLLGVAIYATLRLIYYGNLWGTVLTNCATADSLTAYWSQVANVTSHTWISSFGLVSTLSGVSLSWALGFLTAVGVAAYCFSSVGWSWAFHTVSLRLKALFVLAVCAYVVENTIVPATALLTIRHHPLKTLCRARSRYVRLSLG